MFGIIRNASLKLKLLCSFAIVLLIPGILIGLMSYDTAKDKVGEQLLRSASENVALLDHVVTDTIMSRSNDLSYMSQLFKQADTQGKSPAVLSNLDEYSKLHPEINTVFVGTTAGTFFNSPRVKMADDYDPRKRPWYIDASANNGKAIISSPYISKTTGDFVISLSRALKDGSGVVGAEIKLKDLETLTQSVKIGEKGYAVLIDQNRKVIVNRELEPGSEIKAEWVDELFSSEKGNAVDHTDGSMKQIHFGTNALTGWKIGGVIDEKELDEQAAPIWNRTLMVLAVAFVIFGLLAVLIVWLITRPLQDLAHAASKISEGDLTERARIRGKDEIGRLGTSFNVMADSLRGLLAQIGEVSMQVAASSEQLTASAEQTSKATEQIAESVQEVAVNSEQQVLSVEQGFGSIRNMADGMNRIVEGAKEVSLSSSEASARSEEGAVAMSDVSDRMEAIRGQVDRLEQVIRLLNDRSAAIGQIAELMTGIAQQTNILSINAAIEASRAGEQGRGFAVVAQQVKHLAEQSRESAEQIRDMILTIQKETESAVKVTDTVVEGVVSGAESIRRAGDLFDSIKEGMHRAASQAKVMSSAVDTISVESSRAVAAMEEVARSAEVTADGTHNVSAAAEEQLASMEEIASSSAALASMAEEMQQLISKFKV